ncbi:hypothetical protein AB1Y20_001958 [Prymnesium parvum]|uniref:Uncharacterized protein n=1 Tax=Prymnesium parvum TaxID=97485 RepID=A0AB34JAA8_PRYPA
MASPRRHTSPEGAARKSGTSSDPGIDAVYDGASEMRSTAQLFGTSHGKYATSQTYNSVFCSATPRPWQRKLTQAELKTSRLGPGRYEPYGLHHALASSSTSWTARGRTGPVGCPFDVKRQSTPFRSALPRTANSTTTLPKVPSKMIKEDAFIVNFDAHRASSMQHDFRVRLHSMSMASWSAGPQAREGFRRTFSSRAM